MKSVVWRWLALALLFVLGCSRSSVMDHEQLASERKQLHSLDAETALLDRIIATKHATPTFVHAHAEYLRRASHELAQQLGKARAAPGAEAELERLRADATRLEERFIARMLL
jgi:hypothetical protein